MSGRMSLGSREEMDNILACFIEAAKLAARMEDFPELEPVKPSRTGLLTGSVFLALVTHDDQLIGDLKTMCPKEGARAIYESVNWESLDEDT